METLIPFPASGTHGPSTSHEIKGGSTRAAEPKQLAELAKPVAKAIPVHGSFALAILNHPLILPGDVLSSRNPFLTSARKCPTADV